MSTLQAETLAARERTGDPAISVTVKQGRLRVVRVIYTKGRGTVSPLTGWMSGGEVLAYLKTLGR